MTQEIKALVKNLKNRKIKGYAVKTRKEALKKVLSMIPSGASVGTGGSQTLNEIGLIDALKKRRVKFINKPQKNLSREKVLEKRRKSIIADYFLMSSNAITKDGILINIDGYGNRLAALSFGAKNVIVIVGKNKIVKDIDEGIKRIQPGVVIKNAKRLGWETPCLKKGKCISSGCYPIKRMCNETLIIEGSNEKDRIKVIIVAEDLGY